MPTSGFQDYSALVDPRTLPSEIDSILEAEKTDTLDLNLEIPLPEDSRSRSLKTNIEAIIGEENKNVEAGDGNDATIDLEKLFDDSDQVNAEKSSKRRRRRRRRDTVITATEDNSETQFSDVQGVSAVTYFIFRIVFYLVSR